MGFDISSLVGKSAETEVEIMGEKAVVHFDPSVITQDRLAAAEKGDSTFLEYFCEVIVDWDVTEGGTKVPLKPETIGVIPVAVLRAIFWSVMRINSSGELGKVSSGNSRRRVPQDRATKRRSGTATSRRPATSV